MPETVTVRPNSESPVTATGALPVTGQYYHANRLRSFFKLIWNRVIL